MTDPQVSGLCYEGTMLMTERMHECRHFYRDLLGVEEEVGSGWAMFRLDDGSMLALHAPWEEGMTVTGGSTVLLLRVASLQAQAARLLERGIRCSPPHEIPQGAVSTILDPDGRMVQLVEWNAGAVDRD
ncbi:MAG: VOC family protein [Actinomycetales bacterium]